MKRVDIKTGYLCNNNCLFCVQAHNKMHANKDYDEIIASLKSAKEADCEGVVFTGGEFTLRKDALKLVKTARDMGFSIIQIQSNGRMFSNMDFCKEIIRAGANEFCPALHGHTASIHDYLTRAPGAYAQTVRGIRNLKMLGQYVIANSLVVKPNYRYAPNISRLFSDLCVDQFQYAFVHALGSAWDNFEEMVPYKSLAVPYLKKGIDIAAEAGICVMVESVPFCLMEGYEHYVSELYIPDTRIEEKDRVVDDFKKAKAETQSKVKHDNCKRCKFYDVCEGPWREYPEHFGWDEFVPVVGDKIASSDDIIEGSKNLDV